MALTAQGVGQSRSRPLVRRCWKISTGYGFEIWYYPDPSGGSVTFDDNGSVTSWSEP